MATYSTWNPTDKSPSGTLSNVNLTFTSASATWYTARSTVSVSSGKWYWEVTCTTGLNFMIGIGTASASVANSSVIGVTDAFSWAYNGGGSKYNNGGSTAYGATFSTGDVIGVYLDITGGTLGFKKNNVDQGIAFTGLTGTQFAMTSVNNCSDTANFGSSTLTYSPPTGYNTGLYSGTATVKLSTTNFFMFM